jgi:hypothetical protein
MDQTTATNTEGPLPWRLTFILEGKNEPEEVVLRVQGVLCEKELPPVRTEYR